MKKIVFECETITPMFMYGADGTTPELRPASIKGVMRFWWRAINGNLPLDDYKENDKLKKGLKSQEADIFGNTDKKSSFSIRTSSTQILQTEKINPLPHKFKKDGRALFEISSFKTNQIFEITFIGKNLELVENIFKLTTILGGFGQRSRRGFGSIQIIGSEVLSSTESIENLIKEVNSAFKYKSTINYPYITHVTLKS